MRTFDSPASPNADSPSERSYGSVARHLARSRGLVVLVLAGVPLAIQVVSGQYAAAALVVGTLSACLVGVVAGVAVSLDDARVGVAATASAAVVVAATAVAVRTLGLDDGRMLAVVLALVVVPAVLAAGTFGYTVAERAKEPSHAA